MNSSKTFVASRLSSSKSVISSRLSVGSTYSSSKRETSFQAAQHNATIQSAKSANLREILQNVKENKQLYENYVIYVKSKAITSDEFAAIIQNGQQCVDLLTPKFSKLVHAMLSMPWLRENEENRLSYTKFLKDIITAHNKFVEDALRRLVSHWIPSDDERSWKRGLPNEQVEKALTNLHDAINSILDIIPLTSDKIKCAIENNFPHISKPPHVYAGYVYNILRLLDYRPIFANELIELIFKKLIELDTSASKSAIQSYECDDDCTENPLKDYEDDEMKFKYAETLDLCMEQLFSFIDREYGRDANRKRKLKDLLLDIFENLILPTYNSHHIQFTIFYYSSLKPAILQSFIDTCWSKLNNFNEAPLIRRTAVCYIASFMCHAKFVTNKDIESNLQSLCEWAITYMENAYTMLNNINAMKAHMVYYSVCHAIFHIIAIRIDAVSDRRAKDLGYQLTRIVKSPFNPLRVCHNDIATIFASVTKSHQLVYCQTILERNARHRLATVYSNEIAMPDQTLDIINPFDAYLLKKSGKRISDIYWQQLVPSDEDNDIGDAMDVMDRKRVRLESLSDEYFINPKKVMVEISRSLEKDVHF
ncbi:RNA polymerase I-specific transcription initiation factor RRN3-like [Bradysia coprophila]|uniref:RNA polymerase I-specific transcription initiation factor RRN3-like n=1 Tax=Bradysia coprophila TaxID=38358 RepID=UPI00187D86B6|nr:RNA polymerase I-specific transcription initiation factor RRN3-like [Bradysia coprophila]